MERNERCLAKRTSSEGLQGGAATRRQHAPRAFSDGENWGLRRERLPTSDLCLGLELNFLFPAHTPRAYVFYAVVHYFSPRLREQISGACSISRGWTTTLWCDVCLNKRRSDFLRGWLQVCRLRSYFLLERFV